MTAKYGDCGERFQRWHIAATGHNHIRRDTLVIACPLPDADTFGAMLDGGVHCEPLRRGVLAGDDNVDVVAAAQAMVHYGQQAVCIRWKIDAHNLGFLVYDEIDEPGILVSEAVVILAPNVRCQ